MKSILIGLVLFASAANGQALRPSPLVKSTPFDVVLPGLSSDPSGSNSVSGQMFLNVTENKFKAVDKNGNIQNFAMFDFPSTTGNAGKLLTTDGTGTSWTSSVPSLYIGDTTPTMPASAAPLRVFTSEPNSPIAIFGMNAGEIDGGMQISTGEFRVDLQAVHSAGITNMYLQAQGGGLSIGTPGGATLDVYGIRTTISTDEFKISDGSQGTVGQVLMQTHSDGRAQWGNGVPGTVCGWYDVGTTTTISECNGVDPVSACPTGYTLRTTSYAKFCTADPFPL